MTTTTTGATHDVTAEYGIRKPNGEEQWDGRVNTILRSGDVMTRSIDAVHTDRETRAGYGRWLEATAGEVGIDKAEYVAGHRLITRQRITVILPAVDADPTIQLGSADKSLPWEQ